MNTEYPEPICFPSPTIRHDGWTGEVMGKFLETLAETGIVADACDVAGRSRETAYALRRRNPLFARAWELALGNARDRLADTLLARSIEGNVEQIIKDGEIVAEKHFIDNRLGLAILKRLDKRAEETSRLRRLPPPSPESAEPDWDIALTALRTGDADDIAAALVMLQGDEADKADTPLSDEFEAGSDDFDRVWRTWGTGEWRTDFPPPSGFDGHQEGGWEDDGYCRSLTEEELAAIVAAGIVEPGEVPHVISIEEDEAERDAFFVSLAAGPSPGPSADSDRS